MPFDGELDELVPVVASVGQYQLDQQQRIEPGASDYKGRIDLVTEVDRESERRLVDALSEHFPGDGILAEEDLSRNGTTGREWIIDPLDGTTNFVHGHPFYGISIALRDADTIVEGLAYFPRSDTLFRARRQEGAYRNGTPITVSSIDEPIQSLMATGFADMRTEDEAKRHNVAVFTDVLPRVQGIRRAGSAVHDLCLTAEGVFEGFWEFNLQPWDVAAGALMVREAGGRVTDMTGGEDWLHGQTITASNDVLHDRLLDWIEPHVPPDVTNGG